MPSSDNRKMARGELFDASLLKIGNYYSRSDLAVIQASPSTATNQKGVIHFENCRLLLLDIDKQEYQNRLAGNTLNMRYQANSTQSSPDIQYFKKGLPVYLFTRKTRILKGETQPYQYQGRLQLLEAISEKPVQLKWRILDI